MKRLIKRTMFALAPRAATGFFAARARAHSQRVAREWGCRAIADQIIARYGDVVLGGPFRGMRLTPMCRAEHLSPYLLGLYERELNPVWDVVFRGRPAQILDIGAKFGYYAVGLARRFPAAPVVAFDPDPWARRATREMAAGNATPTVELAAFCDPAWLRAHVRPGALILSDCEGYEAELFGAAEIPALATATLVIETHEAFVPGVGQQIRGVLGRSHRIYTIASDDATGPLPVDLSFLSADQQRLAAQEVRPPQEWLVCLPNHGANAGLTWPAAGAD